MRAARLLDITRLICTPVGMEVDVLAEALLKKPDAGDADAEQHRNDKSVLEDLAKQCIEATISAWKIGFSSPGTLCFVEINFVSIPMTLKSQKSLPA